MNQHHVISGLITCLLIIFLLSLTVMADVLTIPNLGDNSAKSAEDIIRPERGMSMNEVSAQFGNPKQIIPPVGDPPITRWVYEKFTVHFEENFVIHTVVHRP